jgi:predicted permease
MRCEKDAEMLPAAPTSIVALLAASFVVLSLVILGARDPRRERALLVLALGLAGFGAAGVSDVLFELGLYPMGALAVAAALIVGAGIALARSGR